MTTQADIEAARAEVLMAQAKLEALEKDSVGTALREKFGVSIGDLCCFTGPGDGYISIGKVLNAVLDEALFIEVKPLIKDPRSGKVGYISYFDTLTTTWVMPLTGIEEIIEPGCIGETLK